MSGMLRPAGAPAQGLSTTATPSLGSQTVSTLLQAQEELSQSQIHGGGGGHHGGMRMLPGFEAEEAAEEEEAQRLRQRKKLSRMTKASDTSAAVEVDENGVPIKADVEQTEANLPNKEGKSNSGT